MISQKQLGERIKNWREERDLSQEQFARAIELSRVAISEIERGNRGIEATELMRIAKFFDVNTDTLLIDDKTDKSVLIKNNFKFDSKKLKNVLLYILERCGGKPNIGETVLYKLLYFIDFDNFEINGYPLTGLNYINFQFGPVPTVKEYRTVVEEMLKAGQLKIFSQEYYGLSQKRYVALENYEEDSFNLREVRVIDSVINRLSDMSARQIEEYVHEDAPWKLTQDKQVIPYFLAFERSAPYARNDYNKMWQDAAGADTIKRLGPISKEEYDHYNNL